jgi:hypothetical protein
MKALLDQMEEHIAEIRNLQRNFDFHSRRLEKLMKALEDHYRLPTATEAGLSQQSNTND